jgi:hypothetical protein
MAPIAAGVEIDGTTLVLILTVVSVMAGGMVKLIDLLVWFVKERRQNGAAKPTKGRKRQTAEEKMFSEVYDMLKEMRPESKDLHTWHAPEDQNGLKRWWLPPDLRDQLQQIRGHLTAVDKLIDKNSRLTKRVDDLQELRLEEQRDLMREMIEFSARFERGMGRRTSSGTHPIIDDTEAETEEEWLDEETDEAEEE